jgi:hypothetical protein
MATTTTNFGWDIPQSTDLVKDGATAIAALGQDIDTALVDLKGGTTGQILAKASNTDLDYSWITNDVGDITAVTAGTGISGGGTSGAVTVTNSMATAIDAKGDLIGGTGADTFARLAVGANGTILTADSAEATGLKWATPAAGGGGLVFIQKGSFSASSAVNVNTCFSSTYDNYKILVRVTGTSVTNGEIRFRMRSGTTDNSASSYTSQRLYAQSTTVGGSRIVNQTSGILGSYNTSVSFLSTDMFQPFLAAVTGYSTQVSYNQEFIDFFAGAHTVASSFDGFTLFPDSGTITGEVWVYGYAK